MSYRVAAEIGGREFCIEMGRVARQADGAAYVCYGDTKNDPDLMSLSGTSAALYCSPIPFFKPIAGVRVGLMNGAFVINPTTSSLKDSRLNLTIAGNEEAIVMVEAGADEVGEEQV